MRALSWTPAKIYKKKTTKKIFQKNNIFFSIFSCPPGWVVFLAGRQQFKKKSIFQKANVDGLVQVRICATVKIATWDFVK